MSYLILIGIVAILFGLLLLLSPENLKGLSSACDKVILKIDDIVLQSRTPMGIALLIAGFLILWLVWPYLSLWGLNIVVLLALIFCLLLIFFPKALEYLRRWSDRSAFSVDNFVLAARKTVGTLLIIAGIFIIYAALYGNFLK